MLQNAHDDRSFKADVELLPIKVVLNHTLLFLVFVASSSFTNSLPFESRLFNLAS